MLHNFCLCDTLYLSDSKIIERGESNEEVKILVMETIPKVPRKIKAVLQ